MSNENKQSGERAAFEHPLNKFIPLHEDMLRALEHVECVYRLNVVKDDEPSSTLANLQRVIARARATAPQATVKGDERAHTGSAEADRIINRLSSSDPDFDDCADAADLIRKLVKNHRELAGELRAAIEYRAAVPQAVAHPTEKTGSDATTQLSTEIVDKPVQSDAAREEEPSLTNPLKPYGMLVRALRIVAQTTLYDMAQCMLLTPAQLSAMEFGRKPTTPEIVREVATYFESQGVNNTLPALQFAIDAEGNRSPIDGDWGRAGKKSSGRLLDGRTHDEFPEAR